MIAAAACIATGIFMSCLRRKARHVKIMYRRGSWVVLKNENITTE